jgi:hypothetical protein
MFNITQQQFYFLQNYGDVMKTVEYNIKFKEIIHSQTQGFCLGRPFGILPKKIEMSKEPRPNLPNVLRFDDQIGRRLSVFLSNCSGTL